MLDKYTVPTGNRTPGRRMAVHYVTAALRKLHPWPCIKFTRSRLSHIYNVTNYKMVWTGSYIWSKTDINIIPKLAYKWNTFNDIQFEPRFKSTWYFVGPIFGIFTISIKVCFERGGFLFCNDLDLNDPCLNLIHYISYRCSGSSVVMWVMTPSKLNDGIFS